MLEPVDLEDHHPLVATAALLQGRVSGLPSRGGRPAGRRPGRRTLDTAMAAAEAIFSPDGKPLPADRLAFLREEYADMLSRSGLQVRLLFGAIVLLVSLWAPLLVWRPAPFRRLSLPTRIRALTRFEAGRLGMLLIALRALLCLLYYEHPEAAAEIGADVNGPDGARLYSGTPT